MSTSLPGQCGIGFMTSGDLYQWIIVIALRQSIL